MYSSSTRSRTDRYRLIRVEGWYCAWLDGTAVSDTATIADFMAGRVTIR